MPVHPFALGPLRPLAVCWILFAGRALIPILDVISVAVTRIACGELVLLRPAGENYVHNLLTPAVPVRFPSNVIENRIVTAVGDASVGNSGDDNSSTAGGVFFRNCEAARAAGAAPLYFGEPGYRPALDRDRDGVACE